MKVKKVRGMNKQERSDALVELHKELMKLKSKVMTGLTPDNPSRIKQARKDIARILTVMEEEE